MSWIRGALIAFLLAACSVGSAQDKVDWNNDDFRLTFDSPDEEISIRQDYFWDDGVLLSGKITKIPVPYIFFNNSDWSIFGQVAVKRYTAVRSADVLNIEARDVVGEVHGRETIISEDIYEKNGHKVLAVTHRISMSPPTNSTTANVGFGRCAVIVSATSNYFPKIIGSLTFEEKFPV